MKINPGFEEHASPEAILAALDKTRAERKILNGQISRLERLIVRRIREIQSGVWPPKLNPAVLSPSCSDGYCGSCVGQPCEHSCHGEGEA